MLLYLPYDYSCLSLRLVVIRSPGHFDPESHRGDDLRFDFCFSPPAHQGEAEEIIFIS